MRRTTWTIRVALFLALAVAVAVGAEADDLGAPPAGAAGPAGGEEAPLPGVVPAIIDDPAAPPRVLRSVPCAPPTTWTAPTHMPAPGPGPTYKAVPSVPLTSAPCRDLLACRKPSDQAGWARDRCGRPYGRFEVLVEGALTWIDGPGGALGEPVPAGTPAFDWGQSEYDPEFGGRLTLSFRPCPLDRIELRGTYFGHWEASSTQTGAFGFTPPEGGVSPVGTATLTSEADLYSGELTWWRELGCVGNTRFDGGIGVRYVRLDETATMSGLPLPTGAPGGSLSSDVTSELFAAQLGAAYHWDVTRCLELTVIGKAMLGTHRRDVVVTDANLLSGGAHRASSDETEFGWGFELEGRALYRITPRLGVTAGAALNYFGQIGRAEDAFDFSQASTGAVQARQQGDGLLAVTFLVGLHLNF